MIICYQEQTKGRGFPSARSVLFLCRVISWIICGELAFIEMLAAKSDIFVIGAKHDLGTFSDNAMLVVAGVADCFAAAPAHGFYFMTFAVMDLIRAASVTAPVSPGQVIIKNAANTGADIIATAEIK